MRDYIQWRESWLLHIDDLDREHQELVRLFNTLARRLCDSASQQTPRYLPVDEEQTLIAITHKIGRHAKRHFDNEEDRMLEVGFPDYETHRYEHVTLLAEYAELMRDLREQGLQCLDRSTMDALKGWLIGHIAGADRHFGEFYRQTRSGVTRPALDAFSSYWMSRARDQ